jgi:phytoene synthase
MTRKTSFYYAFLVLPRDKREAITAVFDFCRAVDDSVDLEVDRERAEAALTGWREEVHRVFTFEMPQTRQGAELQKFVTPFNLPRAEFDALVDGVGMDVVPRDYQTFADLEPYCHRVASAVGLICAEIFGYRDRAVRDYARDLGVALQLTNILRDVAVDFRRGRLYLPLEDLKRFGCSKGDIQRELERATSHLPPDNIRRLLEFQARRARDFYKRATDALPNSAAREFLPAEIMRAIYWDLLRRIESARYDVFAEVVRVPRMMQALIALRCWLTSR